MHLTSILDLASQAHLPLILWGPPGVGKSSAIQRWAESRQLRCWTVIASLREPSDFGGLPIVIPGTTRDGIDSAPTVHFAAPRFAEEAAREGGVIFLDELTTAPPAVQAALLRAVVDRAFGDLQLDPDKVTLVAAANPPSESAGGWDLAPPLANRFVHFDFPTSTEDWVENFPSYWGRPPRLSFGSAAILETTWRQARTVVAAFVRARPQLLLKVPDHDAQRGGAWPSPRSWDYLSRMIATAYRRPDDIASRLPLLAGCVGEGPALEFLTWVRNLDLPNPEDLIDNPSSYRHPTRGDVAYAVLTSVAEAVIATLTPPRWLAGWTIVSRAAESGGADIAAIAARRLARARSSTLPLPTSQVLAFVPILTAAGLMNDAGLGSS